MGSKGCQKRFKIASKWLKECFKMVNRQPPLHPVLYDAQHRVKRRPKGGQNGVLKSRSKGCQKTVKKMCQREVESVSTKGFKRCQMDFQRMSKGLHKGFKKALKKVPRHFLNPIQPPHGPGKDPVVSLSFFFCQSARR